MKIHSFIIYCFLIFAPVFSSVAQNAFQSAEPNNPGTTGTISKLPGVDINTLTGTPVKYLVDLSVPTNGGLPITIARSYRGESWLSFVPVLDDVYYRPTSGWGGPPQRLLVQFPDIGGVWLRSRSVSSNELGPLKIEWRVDRDWVDLDGRAGYRNTNVYQSASGWRAICGYYNTGRSYQYTTYVALETGNTQATGTQTVLELLSGCVIDSPQGVRYIFEGGNNARLKASFENARAGGGVNVPEEITQVEFVADKPRVYPPTVLARVIHPTGQYTSYTYQQNGSRTRLKSITSSTGGAVNFTYEGSNVTAIVPGGQIVYSYTISTTTPRTYRLDKVTGLSGSHVNYSYSSSVSARDEACSSATLEDRLSEESYSSGATIRYEYRMLGWLASAWVHNNNTWIQAYASCWPALAAVSTRSAPADAWANWRLTYSPEGKMPTPSQPGFYGTNQTTITNPLGEYSVYAHTPMQIVYSLTPPQTSSLDPKAGLLTSIKRFDANKLLEQHDIQWAQLSVVADPAPTVAGCMFRESSCNVFEIRSNYWHNVPNQVAIRRFDSGASAGVSIWTVEQQTFDSYGNPALIKRTDPSGLVRYHEITYFVDTTANILRTIKNETVRE